MRADSVARLTAAPVTPGTLFSAFSTRVTQEAQVMPPMPRSSVADAEGFVVVFMSWILNLAMMAGSSVAPDQPCRTKGWPTRS